MGESAPTTTTMVRAHLRLESHDRMIKQVVFEMYKAPTEGDLLMSDGRSQKQSRGYKRAMEVQGTSTETTTHNNSQDGVTHRARTNIHLHDK